MSLTAHVLDLTSGRPAAGMQLTLTRFDDPTTVPVRVVTNLDGRTDAPLLAGSDLAAGRYELAFGVGAYFAAAGTSGGDGGAAPPSIPYLDVVPVHFGVAPGTERLHVALLVTPFSYTTYRGS